MDTYNVYSIQGCKGFECIKNLPSIARLPVLDDNALIVLCIILAISFVMGALGVALLWWICSPRMSRFSNAIDNLTEAVEMLCNLTLIQSAKPVKKVRASPAAASTRNIG